MNMMTENKKLIRNRYFEQSRQLKGNNRHTVRIIGGRWKRTPIMVIDAQGLRPTPERVRETLFNWLGHFWESGFELLTCLDMFAGSGALGFEAASRGFKQIVMIEKNRLAWKSLQTIKEKLNATQIQICLGDAIGIIEKMFAQKEQFNLICLDPPFHEHLLPMVLPRCEKLLKNQGMIYVESDQAITENQLINWDVDNNLRIVREGRAGQVYYHLLEKQV